MELESLQIYWWVLISVLGSLLVFLLFVQGGQTMLLSTTDQMAKTMMVNSLGRKWELTFTTLVVFGGAFFASFPLFYSTSFGGAYWLWMLILFSFVLQAVSYEFRRKPGNLLGGKTYETFLFINGCLGCILLGVAVGTMFFGGDFTIAKGNLLDGSSPVISRWGPLHGLEAIGDWRNLLLGLTVLFLARALAALYFLNNILGGGALEKLNRKRVLVNGAVFVVLFLAFAAVLLTSKGYRLMEDGGFESVRFKYFLNFVQMWWCLALFLAGVLSVLYGLYRGAFVKGSTRGIWFTGVGTVLVVMTLFWVAGFNSTPYLPSLRDPASSLTIYNSSSSRFTLTVMSWVSVLVPFVLAYIVYAWYSMDRKSITPEEMEAPGHKY